MKYLVETLQTPIGAIDENHRQCQEYSFEEMAAGGRRGRLQRGEADEEGEEQTPAGVRIKKRYKMPGKMEAANLLAKLGGWLAAEKHNVTLTGPEAVVASVLGRK
jgi:hypothetical protein